LEILRDGAGEPTEVDRYIKRGEIDRERVGWGEKEGRTTGGGRTVIMFGEQKSK